MILNKQHSRKQQSSFKTSLRTHFWQSVVDVHQISVHCFLQSSETHSSTYYSGMVWGISQSGQSVFLKIQIGTKQQSIQGCNFDHLSFILTYAMFLHGATLKFRKVLKNLSPLPSLSFWSNDNRRTQSMTLTLHHNKDDTGKTRLNVAWSDWTRAENTQSSELLVGWEKGGVYQCHVYHQRQRT